jgi:hypothetical protein
MNKEPATHDRATVMHGGVEHRCKNLIYALCYAVELVPLNERGELRMVCDRGQKLDWSEVLALYQQHQLGGYLVDEVSTVRH